MPSRARIATALSRAGKRALPGLIAVAAVAAVGGAGWLGYYWLTTSERFAIEAVDVRGAQRIDAGRVRELSQIDHGDNVFLVDPSAAARAIEADPWVASAGVERQLPDRIVIEIEERTPHAIVELGGLYLADAGGHVFKRAAIDLGEGEGLPLITGLSRDEYLADEGVAQATIRAALEAARVYARDGERPSLGEVHVDARSGITLVTYDSALALRLGATPADGIAARLEAFDAAWSALDEDERDAARVIYMDNETNPDRITVRFGGNN